MLDKVLAAFDQQMANAAVDYVSVANRDQFNRYRKEHPGARNLVWVDWGYGQTLLKKGYIAAAQALEGGRDLAGEDDPHAALRRRWIYREGFCAQQAGPIGRGRQVVRDSRGPDSAQPTEKSLEPAALRGLGFTLIELKDLPGARKSVAGFAADRARESARAMS